MSHLPGPSPRRELVAYLAGEGMSTRAIAPIVGVSKSQVANDVEVSRTGHVGPAPTPIHGRDGKTYVRPEPKPDRAAQAVESYRAAATVARSALLGTLT